ncbi:MAG: phosphopantetheine-binding protein [Bacteroidales bacterium]|jgi:acyl carrier protein|nr:phosphopantetheine-binding protein [Bacteroidales bacterium]
MGEKIGSDLKADIKSMIIETLNIEDITPEDIDDDLPLFGGENTLGLDSIDAIELVMAVQRQYKVRIDDQNLAREVLKDVNSIAEFINNKAA